MEKLKVAVIGCGCISCMHLDAVRDLELSELTAVCDIVPERARAASEKYSVPYYTDYKKTVIIYMLTYKYKVKCIENQFFKGEDFYEI